MSRPGVKGPDVKTDCKWVFLFSFCTDYRPDISPWENYCKSWCFKCVHVCCSQWVVRWTIVRNAGVSTTDYLAGDQGCIWTRVKRKKSNGGEKNEKSWWACLCVSDMNHSVVWAPRIQKTKSLILSDCHHNCKKHVLIKNSMLLLQRCGYYFNHIFISITVF